MCMKESLVKDELVPTLRVAADRMKERMAGYCVPDTVPGHKI